MRSLIFSLFLGWAFSLSAQNTLGLNEAVQVALERNYGILVARNDLEISQNNAYPGRAGLWPRLDFSGGFTYRNNNLTFDRLQFDENTGETKTVTSSLNGIATDNSNLGLNLTYTVFDGLGNVNSFKVLKTSAGLSEEQTRATIENTISQVINAYYQVARLGTNLAIIQNAAEVSRARLERARAQREFGSANRLDVLNAEVDLSSDSVTLENAALGLENAKRDLLTLMGEEIGREFDVDLDVEFLPGMDMETLFQDAMTQNVNLSLAEYSQQIAELNFKVAQSARYPQLDINASYGYNRSNNGPASFVQRQQVLGLTAGASLNFNIFNGKQTSINIQNSEIDLASSRIRYQETKKQLERDISNAIANYENSLRILELEKRSLAAAELNFEATVEAYKLGQATNIAFRDAQINLFRTQSRLAELGYDIKLFETELLRLAGLLWNE